MSCNLCPEPNTLYIKYLPRLSNAGNEETLTPFAISNVMKHMPPELPRNSPEQEFPPPLADANESVRRRLTSDLFALVHPYLKNLVNQNREGDQAMSGSQMTWEIFARSWPRYLMPGDAGE